MGRNAGYAIRRGMKQARRALTVCMGIGLMVIAPAFTGPAQAALGRDAKQPAVVQETRKQSQTITFFKTAPNKGAPITGIPIKIAMTGFFDPFDAVKSKRSRYQRTYKKSKSIKAPPYALGAKLPPKGHLKSYDYNNSLDFHDPDLGKYLSPRENLRYQRRASTTYRTLCVRLQDGYYWPINFAQTKRKLAKDQRKCEQSCTAKVRLFIVPSTETDMGEMKDLKGRRYAALSTAFLYRTKYIKEAQCKPEPWSQAAQAKHETYAQKDAHKKRRLHVRATKRAERRRVASLKRRARLLKRKHLRTARSKRRYKARRVARYYRRKKQ